jgi:hypothetical protein
MTAQFFYDLFQWKALWVMGASTILMIVGLKIISFLAIRFGPEDE